MILSQLNPDNLKYELFRMYLDQSLIKFLEQLFVPRISIAYWGYALNIHKPQI